MSGTSEDTLLNGHICPCEGTNGVSKFDIYLHGFDKRKDTFNADIKRIDAVNLNQAKRIANKLLNESAYATSVEIHDHDRAFDGSCLACKTLRSAWENLNAENSD